MSDFENSDEREAREAEQASYDRLVEATYEQCKLGPKGLHPDAEFDSSTCERYMRQYRPGIPPLYQIGYPVIQDIFPICWCRIYLSVVTINLDIVMIHYDFENLYDGILWLEAEDYLFSVSGRERIERIFIKEDITINQRSEIRLPWRGITENVYRPRKWLTASVIQSSEIYTVTRKVVRQEDGLWDLSGYGGPGQNSGFGECLPGHIYKFQLIYGGLPSNVFTWVAPE